MRRPDARAQGKDEPASEESMGSFLGLNNVPPTFFAKSGKVFENKRVVLSAGAKEAENV